MKQYLFLRFPNGKPKAVTLSYDDAVRSDLKLAEILDAHEMKATFNIPSAFLNSKRLSAEEIKHRLYEKGHEIAIHCASHIAPGLARPIDGIQEVLKDRLALEEMLDCIIRGMAYPDSGITTMANGASYDNIRHYLKDLNIAYSRTLGGDNNRFELPTDWYAWMPTAHHENPNLFEYIEQFTAFDPKNAYPCGRTPRLFYLWGHSYEFENNHNWDRLEMICEKLSGKDDIWYATNIEIYDYVQAYSSLRFSADGKRVYNPSLLTVWFESDEKLYSVTPGEMIRI